jgi:hypothetical protein
VRGKKRRRMVRERVLWGRGCNWLGTTATTAIRPEKSIVRAQWGLASQQQANWTLKTERARLMQWNWRSNARTHTPRILIHWEWCAIFHSKAQGFTLNFASFFWGNVCNRENCALFTFTRAFENLLKTKLHSSVSAICQPNETWLFIIHFLRINFFIQDFFHY